MLLDIGKRYLSIKPSKIAGYGVFSSIKLTEKTILAIPQNGLFTDDYNTIVNKQTAIRYCLNVYQYGDETTLEDYLNHSDNPNCMYHCGILFVIKDIPIGEELTIDYAMLIPRDMKIDYVNNVLSGKESFKKGLMILNKLFNKE